MKPKVIVITGASSGIGAALAMLYSEPGVVFGLIGRDPTRLREVADMCVASGAKVERLECDVRNTTKLQSWIRAFADVYPIDLVIASAGLSGSITADGRLEEREQVQQLIETNLLGVVNTIDAIVPAMIDRGDGHIAVLSSLAGYRGLPYSPAYSASKAGIRAYAEGIRAYLRPYGVGVTVICPGFVDTPMTDRFKGSHPFLVSLPRAATIIKRGLDKKKSRIAFPAPLALELRAADLIPAWLGDFILRRVRFRIVPSPGMAQAEDVQ